MAVPDLAIFVSLQTLEACLHDAKAFLVWGGGRHRAFEKEHEFMKWTLKKGF